MNEAILELTELLIKQDIKDKKEGIEYIKIPKIQVIKENIKLIKLLEKYK